MNNLKCVFCNKKKSEAETFYYATPVRNGACCNECHESIVIPAMTRQAIELGLIKEGGTLMFVKHGQTKGNDRMLLGKTSDFI